jgi:hypothetical protein
MDMEVEAGGYRLSEGTAQMSIKPFFRWYDLWIGAYVDTQAGAVYICPLPMLGVRIQYRKGF